MDGETHKLETRHSPTTGRFQVRIDGRWRQKKTFEETCFCCWRKTRERHELEYHGVENDDGTTTFWTRCPECGYESRPQWVGKPKERGDNGQGWLRARRASAGY